MPGDLHTHSNYSDGSVNPEKVVWLAAKTGLTSLAISDHDSMESVRYGYAHPVQHGVELIPALELSSYDYERQHRVHILCYYPDDCPALEEHCELMGRRRTQATLQSCRELEAICPQFSTQDAWAYCGEGKVLYKAHVMRALMDAGLADNIYGDLYHELFALRPVPGKVIHEAKYRPVEEVLATVRACRGVAVIAHPSVYHSMPLVEVLAARGLIDGVEIHHPRNTPQDKERLEQLAREYGLLVTGGTDYHGMNSKVPHPVGTCQTDDETIQAIKALAQSRKTEKAKEK